ncbi:MAG: HyaD/HybD family hydrogenase maturation endopeptidase [Caldimicrobium sp.]|jgi:hydrogenase maturation protease
MKNKKILIVGLGNILLSDEGLGVKVIKELEEEIVFPKEVEILDGGTGAFFLIPHFEKADLLIIVDAIKTGEKPGSVIIESLENLSKATLEKISLHEIGLTDLLKILELKGKTFEKIIIAGIEPKTFEVGTELSKEVKKNFPLLKKKILEILRDWGIKI